ncbi:MAG: RagB/SusD family nutrient uptake outer membrane protein [Tannerella sp.]|nr:RagB/SusD family nutrient uptake outer membrane protein [Tannerella sp.]
MKKKILKSKIAVIIAFFLTLSAGCNDFLQLESLEKVSADQLLSSEEGLRTLLADLYNSAPMEDFNFRWDWGFNRRGWGQGVSELVMTSMMTDESVQSDGGHGVSTPGGQYFDNSDAESDGDNDSRNGAYKRNRDVSIFLENIEEAKNAGTINEATFNRLSSEAHFIRAYIYFGLAKRYGGVPIIENLQDNDYVPGSDNAALFVPRRTEKDTWTFILKECDLAVAHLPEKASSADGIYRATKWAAYALKSRAALHAASLAKYWNRAPLAGEAATQNLVGMAPADAAFFYDECLSASREIIDHSGHSLYMPNPASPEEAATNFQYLFLTANDEIIFSRAYLDGTTIQRQGHDYDIRYSPAQSNPGFHKFGRFSPTLDIVDLFEDYTDDGTGKSARIVTRTDGKEDFYTPNPNNLDVNIPFKKYDDLYEPFKNKDARLLASIIVPGATYKSTKIVMQGGLIGKGGNVTVYASGSEVGQDGNTYYTYGAESAAGYSGFFAMGRSDDANFSCSGFSVRKYLAENKTVAGVERSSTTPWIDFRLGEIYLNYAEAVVESGKGDQAAAAQYINALRKRAGHKDNIPLTLDNVLKERRVELAFEGLRYWDMFRRRDYHTFFTSGRRHALVPMIDLREPAPKYVFVRVNLYYDEQAGGRTFNPADYYFSIPGTNTNNLVQNPGH